MLARVRPRPSTGRFASSRRLLPLFSQGHHSRANLHCVTATLDPLRASEAELKRAAIDALARSRPCGTRPQEPFTTGSGSGRPFSDADAQGHENAAVILASRSLASWLDDDGFVSQLLGSAGLLRAAPDSSDRPSHPREVHVLSAAVDEVPRFDSRSGFFSSSEGLSVLCGRVGRDVADPWRDEKVEEVVGAQPCLHFRALPVGRTGPLRVTVPLANTVFSNGRSHTLSASLWRAGSGAREELRLARRAEKTSQAILSSWLEGSPGRPMWWSSARARVACPLVPVTQPRRIAAGLGNILRQVDLDGVPAPASRELEAVIPALLAQRQKHATGRDGGDLAAPGPVGVWALMLPAKYAEGSPEAMLEPLDCSEYDPSDELVRADRTMEAMDELIARGCQLRKILSGGGGWGAKQGLLSLDPQTSLTTGDQDDLESFIRSFEDGHHHSNRGGIVGPGSYVQFFVEPASLPPEQGGDTRFAPEWYTGSCPTLVVGTSGASPGIHQDDDLVVAWPALFGAVSSQGIYLSPDGPPGVSETVDSKLDAPRAYVISAATL